VSPSLFLCDSLEARKITIVPPLIVNINSISGVGKGDDDDGKEALESPFRKLGIFKALVLADALFCGLWPKEFDQAPALRSRNFFF
jgi:hypothetical protein